MGGTPLARGLLVGMLGALAAGGAIIALGRLFAESVLAGGDAAYALLFGAIFAGIALGVALGPRALGDLSRRRVFGPSIVGAGSALTFMSLVPNLFLATVATLLVGAFAGRRVRRRAHAARARDRRRDARPDVRSRAVAHAHRPAAGHRDDAVHRRQHRRARGAARDQHQRRLGRPARRRPARDPRRPGRPPADGRPARVPLRVDLARRLARREPEKTLPRHVRRARGRRGRRQVDAAAAARGVAARARPRGRRDPRARRDGRRRAHPRAAARPCCDAVAAGRGDALRRRPRPARRGRSSGRRSSAAPSCSPTATSTARWPTRAPAASSRATTSPGCRAGPPRGSRPTWSSCSTSTRWSACGAPGDTPDRIEAESLEFHRAGARGLPRAGRAGRPTATSSSPPTRPSSRCTRPCARRLAGARARAAGRPRVSVFADLVGQEAVVAQLRAAAAGAARLRAGRGRAAAAA